MEQWNYTAAEAIALQKRLAGEVKLQPLPSSFEVIGASDLAYVRASNQSVAVMVTFRWPQLEPLETASVIAPTTFPYIPGLLSFREVPPLLEAYQKLKRPPDILLCDGQGLAHPRKLGIACHLGLSLQIPTVGCAKSRLCGKHAPLDLKRGNYTPLYLYGEVVGYVFCSRDGVKPLYISPGHMADLESSLEVIRRCLGRYRLPEPLRHAHNQATLLRQEISRTSACG